MTPITKEAILSAYEETGAIPRKFYTYWEEDGEIYACPIGVLAKANFPDTKFEGLAQAAALLGLDFGQQNDMTAAFDSNISEAVYGNTELFNEVRAARKELLLI